MTEALRLRALSRRHLPLLVVLALVVFALLYVLVIATKRNHGKVRQPPKMPPLEQ